MSQAEYRLVEAVCRQTPKSSVRTGRVRLHVDEAIMLRLFLERAKVHPANDCIPIKKRIAGTVIELDRFLREVGITYVGQGMTTEWPEGADFYDLKPSKREWLVDQQGKMLTMSAHLAAELGVSIDVVTKLIDKSYLNSKPSMDMLQIEQKLAFADVGTSFSSEDAANPEPPQRFNVGFFYSMPNGSVAFHVASQFEFFHLAAAAKEVLIEAFPEKPWVIVRPVGGIRPGKRMEEG